MNEFLIFFIYTFDLKRLLPWVQDLILIRKHFFFVTYSLPHSIFQFVFYAIKQVYGTIIPIYNFLVLINDSQMWLIRITNHFYNMKITVLSWWVHEMTKVFLAKLVPITNVQLFFPPSWANNEEEEKKEKEELRIKVLILFFFILNISFLDIFD